MEWQMNMQINMQNQMRDQMTEMMKTQTSFVEDCRRKDSERESALLKQIEEQSRNFQAVSLNKSAEKMPKCPRWEKDESVENFIDRLKIWDKIVKSRSKYLDLIEALQISEKKQNERK